MPLNVAIDDDLVERARRLGNHKTKKAAVTETLREYVKRRKQLLIMDLFGTIDYDPDYDHKTQRQK